MARSAFRRALLVVTVGVVGLAVPALMTTAAAAPTAQTAVVRGGHFSPDTPGVDVYLTAFSGGTSTLWLTNVGYGDVSPYGRIAAGLYAVSMRPHGAPASTPPALTWTLDAKPGAAYTAAAVGMNSQLHGIVLHDELTTPKSGAGLVRVIQAASRAPHADIVANGGPVVAKDVAFSTSTDYSTVPAGSWPITAQADSAPSVKATSDVQIASGTVSSIVVLDAKGSGITLRSIVDAAGAQTAPIGPVQAGGGGTAKQSAGPVWLRVVLIVLGVTAAGLTVAGMRRNGRRHPVPQ
jgi:hypothetical protein